MNNWQKVFETQKAYQAEIVKALLEEQQYNPVVVSKQDSSYHWGTFQVFVAPEHVLNSIKLIQDEIQFG